MKIQLLHTYNDITCLENLLLAWQEFIIGKKSKPDVQLFTSELMDNIVALHEDLSNNTYQHGNYQSFYINDPKRRHIHKASVRDRLLHHAIYRQLYPFFDKTFIADSYSCRKNKGMHKAINRFRSFAYEVSQNHTFNCWVLKCDIKKFFASIDHNILLLILKQYIPDQDIILLLKNIIKSFHTGNKQDKGLPLGNLTSQLFTNVYMNKFDHWVKHKLKVKYYIRYADDFVFLLQDKASLETIVFDIRNFLKEDLSLTLHPDKISIKTFGSGIDFLGWKHFHDHRILRKTTKKRMFGRICEHPVNETLQSYLGLLKHGNTVKLQRDLYWDYWSQTKND